MNQQQTQRLLNRTLADKKVRITAYYSAEKVMMFHKKASGIAANYQLSWPYITLNRRTEPPFMKAVLPTELYCLLLKDDWLSQFLEHATVRTTREEET